MLFNFCTWSWITHAHICMPWTLEHQVQLNASSSSSCSNQVKEINNCPDNALFKELNISSIYVLPWSINAQSKRFLLGKGPKSVHFMNTYDRIEVASLSTLEFYHKKTIFVGNFISQFHWLRKKHITLKTIHLF
jgi:hypothetical protein